MRISQQQLRRIIAEEYAKEEGIEEGKVEDLLAAIKGGPKPDWYDDKKETPPPPVPKGSGDAEETMPIPRDDAPESEYSGFQDRSGPDVEDQLAALIQGMDPETVAELFQSVFEKIPGVEMGDAEEDPETLYSPGAEGRPQVGFNELKQFIRKVLSEGHYHDMGGEDEMYDALDPQGFDKMSDYELMDAMHTDGMEDMIIRDGEGALVNREEVIAALKNV